MRTTFTKNVWEDYFSWQKEDKKILRKINDVIKAIGRTPFEGMGKPVPLKFDLTGYWSQRITREHRLVYKFQDNEIQIFACRFHCD